MLFPRHQKIQSWLLIWRVGLPTLMGIIVADWSAEVERQVRDFASSLGASSLLLRSDKAPETGDYPPGGDIEPLDLMYEAATRYLKRGRLVFLLEPLSRFDDLYSVSVGFRGRTRATVEIVGPGFDASDLKRGDASPHEWLDIAFSSDGIAINSHSKLGYKAYRRSWEARLAKVGRLVLGEYPSVKHSNEDVARTGQEWLEGHGFQLLLVNRGGYQSIPEPLLMRVLADCQRLPERFSSLGFEDSDFVLSMSYIGLRAQPVYWDIVWPASKFVLPSRHGLKP